MTAMRREDKAMTEAENQALLRVANLRGGYGSIPILRGANLEVAAGECVGVLGHNGAGKTTLIRALAGLLPGTSGSILLEGEEMSSLPAHDRSLAGFALVPQGRDIFPDLTVAENLALACAGLGEEHEEDAVAAILDLFPQLRPLLARRGGRLSGGQQQILAVARALAPRPLLLLLDEPTEGVQPSVADDIADALNAARESGAAILLVEQNPDFAARVCQRVYVMTRGEITATLTGTEARSAAALEAVLGFGAADVPIPDSPEPVAPAAPAPPEPEPAAQTQAASDAADAPDAPDAPAALSVPMPPPAPSETTHMKDLTPTLEQLRRVAQDFGMRMSDAELSQYRDILAGALVPAYDYVDSQPDNLPEVTYPRTPGRRPAAAENPLNAWYVQCEVRGASSGPLAGRQVVLKDNICLAGVPMMNGASTMEGYTPDTDATVVRRILDAGGTISGKAHCEYLCLSGGSHTCAAGAVKNPWNPSRSAGGSSSGCGALVGAGEVDMAVGGDQGGSIRIPSGWCGCYGMKGTHGLVPYTGAVPIEATIDTLGPITSNVADNALLLEVLAGDDGGLDQRQYAPQVGRYTEALGEGVGGLRIGIVREGFSHEGSEPDVSAKVRQAADRLRELGAEVFEISIPMHEVGAAIWTPICVDGLVDMMMEGNAGGTNYRGLFVTGLMDAHARWRERADELSPSLKACMLAGGHFQRHHHGRYYAKARNLERRLRGAYDDALQQADMLLMPTLPMKATPLPPPDAALSLTIQRAFEMIPNTAPFSCTGHPAMNIPCGLSEGLPIGMMLVARHWNESTIYRAAAAFEQSGDWREF